MTKKNNGKPLEKTIQLIEETFKNSEHSKVFRNHKLICESGLKREFDVVIVSNVNGFEVVIAFECKDYKDKVSIEKIDAFKGKCLSVKEISKMVFVSSNGFQTGATMQAKKYGIHLMTAEKVSIDYLENLIPIVSPFLLEIDKINPDYKITVGSNNNINESELVFNHSIIENETDVNISVYQFVEPLLKLSENGIQGLALHHYVKNKASINQNSMFTAKLGLEFPNSKYYIKDIHDNNIDVTRIEFEISIKLIRLDSEKSARVIRNEDDSIKAYSVIMKIDEKSESEMIIKPNNEISYFYTENMEIKQLKTLYQYDNVTGKIFPTT